MTLKQNRMHPAITYAEQIAYSSREVLHFSYEMGKKYKDSKGSFCECGVAAGAQLIAMGCGAPGKTIFGFDSFEGIPLPSNKDNQMPGIRMLSEWEQKSLPDPGKQALVTSGATAVPMDDVLAHIKNSGVKAKYILVPGWFENVLPHYDTGPISILRLDGDLYNSTYVCLKYLYPKLIKGGLLIIDDYGLPGCMEAVLDYFEENNLNRLSVKFDFIEDESSTAVYGIK